MNSIFICKFNIIKIKLYIMYIQTNQMLNDLNEINIKGGV